MKIIFGIEIEQYISSLSEAERSKYKDLTKDIAGLLYIADDMKNNPEEIAISNYEKTEIVKDLTCSIFELYLNVENDRNFSVGRGVTIEINSSWDAEVDWSKAAQA